MSKKVLVPVANGTEPMNAVVTIDVLQRVGADVTVAFVEKQLRVEAGHGVKLVADSLISDCADAVFDLISMPFCHSIAKCTFVGVETLGCQSSGEESKGGMPGASNLRYCNILVNMVKKQAADGRPYAAICASPAVALGSRDLLKGVKSTGDVLSIFHGAIIVIRFSNC